MAGRLWAWGTNYVGKLGDNSTTRKSSPVQTAAFGTNWLKPASSSATNTRTAAAIKDDGTLWTWGYNINGQLGDNTSSNKSSPIQTVAGGTSWSDVSCGYSFISAVKKDGTLWCWGRNLFGQIGDNTTTDKSSPVQTLTFATNWASTSAAIDYVAGIKTDGTLWLWGRNYWGNLGDGTRTDKSSPVQTAALGTNWSQVSCGQRSVVAVKTDGSIWSWGDNGYGQLGDNTTDAKSSPVQVLGGTNWSSVSAGSFGNLAIKKDGTLWSWGRNNSGELGDNTSVRKSSPVQIVGGGTNWTRVSAGYYHAVATKSDGTLWSWGRGALGQLGNNTNTTQVSSPVQTVMASTSWSYVYANTDSTYAIEVLPPSLSVATSASQIYNAQPFGVQPVINLYDSSNNLMTSGTYAVSASSVSGTLSLGGTTTANSSGGVAAFSDLSLTGTGTGSLLFTASGFTSVINGPLSILPPVPVMPIRTETSGKIPTSGQLYIGEIAINLRDQIGYAKKNDGSIIQIFNGVDADGGVF